jgi:putative ABC transport system permease protein
MDQLITIVQLSGIFSLVTLSAMFTFRFAGFPDLSVDGVFTLGAVVLVKLLTSGCPFVISLVGALCAGFLAGSITSIIASKLKINPLLASVLILTILYSLNLRILGTANLPIIRDQQDLLSSDLSFTILVVCISALVILTSIVFFRTEIGAALRCSGNSPRFLLSVGRNVTLYKTVLVAMGSGSIAMAGALLSFKFGFADVTLGTGTIIVGVASLIIGEKLSGRDTLVKQILSVPIGIFVYEVIVGIALRLGISPLDVKLATGILAIFLLTLGKDEQDRLFAQNI